MKIHDLTRGKYPSLMGYIPKDKISKELIDAELISPALERFLEEHQLHKEDAIRLMDNVPVFLVESSMAHEYIAVPGDECSIRVPADIYANKAIEFDVDEWLEDMKDEEHGKHKDQREWECNGHTISDLLGVYVFGGNESVIPCRIFIWVDKIVEYFNRHTEKYLIDEKIEALYALVLRHEMMHVLMDVAAYGIAPCPYFNYSNPIYRYVEEALANYMALVTSRPYFDEPNTNCSITLDITTFVELQGGGYAVGLDLFNMYITLEDSKYVQSQSIRKQLPGIAAKWMNVKTKFNYATAELLAEMWKKCIEAEDKYEKEEIDREQLGKQRAKAILQFFSKFF